MRETKFIDQNRDKWSKFEKTLKDNEKDPEELSGLFMEVTDDLSYSRTFYPNRSVRVYLNNLAQKIFFSIYRNRKSRLKKFWQFWRDDVPQILYETKFDLLLSFIVFMLAISIGVLSSIMDPDFCRIILGDSYIDMTLDNIKSGKPMSVYQDPNQTSMFLNITFNNLRVAFITFILGLLFGAGTIYILIANGVMVGAFQYFFIKHGIYADSILTIWLHGAIEISSIVIAGAAGIHLGRGMLFPGTYTRMQGLQLSARRSLLIYLTIVPLIIMAGFIESFITRYSDASYLVRAIFIIVSFAFMIGYFVIYPWLKAKRGFTSSLREVNIFALKEKEIDFKNIKNSGNIFSETFSLFRMNVSKIAIFAAIFSLVYASLQGFFDENLNFNRSNNFLLFIDSLFYAGNNALQLLCPKTLGLQWVLNIIGMSVMAYFALFVLSVKAGNKAREASFYFHTILSTLIICGTFNTFLTLEMTAFSKLLLIVFVLPLMILWLSSIFNDGLNLLTGFAKSIKLLSTGWSVMMGTYLVVILLCFIILLLTTAPILNLILEISMTIIPQDRTEFFQFREIFFVFIQSFVLCFLYPLLFFSISLGQFSSSEACEANDLYERLKKVGQHKRSFGLVKEDSND